jgi:hypothetical protein
MSVYHTYVSFGAFPLVYRIDRFVCQDEFFVNKSMKMISMVSTLFFICLAFFGLGDFGLAIQTPFKTWVRFMLSSPRRLSSHFKGLRRNFSETCTKFDAYSLSDPSQNLIRPDARLQIKGRKNQHAHPAAWYFVYWLIRYASTIIYRCIALLQLMYRWRHQTRKLWIPLVSRKIIAVYGTERLSGATVSPLAQMNASYSSCNEYTF